MEMMKLASCLHAKNSNSVLKSGRQSPVFSIHELERMQLFMGIIYMCLVGTLAKMRGVG